MDPLSITAGCVGIIGAIAKTSSSIRDFVRDVREARTELSATARHLTELEMTISLIKDDHSTRNTDSASQIPENITAQTVTVIKSCSDILTELETLMNKYNPKRHRTALKWALKGRDDVSALNKQLEAHTRTLTMALEISTLVVARSIKADTSALCLVSGQIKDDTAQLRKDTEQIIDELDKLKSQVAVQVPDHARSRIDLIERYLDSLTSYAETAVDTLSMTYATPPVSERADTPTPISPVGISSANADPETAFAERSLERVPPVARRLPFPRAPSPGTVEYLSPASRFTVLLCGPPQGGKSNFIDRLNRMALDTEEVGSLPDSNLAIYDLEISTSDYHIIDDETGLPVDHPGLGQSLKSYVDASYSIKKSNSGNPHLRLRLIKYYKPIVLRPVQFRVIKRRLRDFASFRRENWNGEIDAIAFFLNTLHRLPDVWLDGLKRGHESMPDMVRNLAVIHTQHIPISGNMGVRYVEPGLTVESARYRIIASRRSLFKAPPGPNVHLEHFFLDNLQELDMVFEELMSTRKTVHDILQLWKSQMPERCLGRGNRLRFRRGDAYTK